MTSLNDIVEQIDLLAPIPAIASQIMTKSEDPDSSMSEIADLIVNDPALTANLLKICNSAYFSLPPESGVSKGGRFLGRIGSNCRTCCNQQRIC